MPQGCWRHDRDKRPPGGGRIGVLSLIGGVKRRGNITYHRALHGDRPNPPDNTPKVITPFSAAIRGSVMIRTRLMGRIGSGVTG